MALVPDVFCRAGDRAPSGPGTAFSGQEERARLFGLISGLSNERITAGAGAYADFLLVRPEVRGPVIGTTGYRMGGRMSLPGQALTSAGVEHTIEFYPGHHGFAVPDNAPCDQALAERHWQALRGFYAQRLS